MTTQNYNEYYWKLTLAHSDFLGSLFNEYLRKIVSFIDNNKALINRDLSLAYANLQEQLIEEFTIDDASVRKAINQFVKLGFINSGLSGYNSNTKNFLNESDDSRKMTIFSKIVYSNSSFSRSITNESDDKEINFLSTHSLKMGAH